MTKHTQQLVLMLVIGSLIGFAIVKVFSGSNERMESDDASTPKGAESAAVENITNKPETLSAAKQFPLPPSVPQNTRVGLSVSNQAAARTVAVSNVFVEAVSWVAVYEGQGGTPGSILGAAKVKPGETSAIVELLRPEGTLSGLTYFAAILPDNGDGEFNRLSDLPSFSPDKVVVVTFKAI